MNLIKLRIQRIVIHQVYQRDENGEIKTPRRSHDLTRFDDNAMAAFRERVVGSLGESSKAVQMDIFSQDNHRVPAIIDSLSHADDASFVNESYVIAERLSEAQTRKNLPGGIVVVFSGTYGVPAKKIVGIIKAEVHSAYEKEENEETKEISLKFVEEVLLTPSARLYKTAGFLEKTDVKSSSDDLNDKWVVFVSDYQIGQSDGRVAAKYFYSEFLGCCYQQTSARTTKHFYDATTEFIHGLNVSEIEKFDLLNALTTYMKVDTSSLISISTFAERYISAQDTKDDFESFMMDKGIPSCAFTKDVELIKKNLKFRKMIFGKSIKITASPEEFKDKIDVEPYSVGMDEYGAPVVWTKVIIKEKITEQE
ncbi:nucleoid-associated protein [Aeromonas sobria]|uniref:nucleoid-associated protein n=1 Tax=Aeromonas sobria TaxID=646 RepID=UPI0026EB0E57|nr:nucleoid-associated protein [Aeromonas sobria]